MFTTVMWCKFRFLLLFLCAVLYGHAQPPEEGNQFIFLKRLGDKRWTGTRRSAIVYDYHSLKKVKMIASGGQLGDIAFEGIVILLAMVAI